jgi:hypothetical protein
LRLLAEDAAGSWVCLGCLIVFSDGEKRDVERHKRQPKKELLSGNAPLRSDDPTDRVNGIPAMRPSVLLNK